VGYIIRESVQNTHHWTPFSGSVHEHGPPVTSDMRRLRKTLTYLPLIWSYRWRQWRMAAVCNDNVIQLSPLRSPSLFQFIKISDAWAYFAHLLLSHTLKSWI